MAKTVEGRSFNIKDLIYVLVSVPVSLVLWLLVNSFSRFSNASGKNH